MPTDAHTGRDWGSAHPYLRTYLAQHAAAAGTKTATKLLRDADFLAVAYSRTALPVLAASSLETLGNEPPIITNRREALDLTSRVQEKLHDALDLLQDAIHAMDQLERRGAAPSGIGGWEYVDQLAVHAQLAASVINPAMVVESRAGRFVSVFAKAEVDVRQLTSLKLGIYPTRLSTIAQTLSGLDDLSRRLLRRVTLALDDLHARSNLYSDYQAPYEMLYRTRTHVDHARLIALSIRK